MDEIDFLSLEDVLDIHARVLAKYGGGDGIIDPNVIASAVAQPSLTMFGRYLHEDITHMAAAYLWHLASQQGFRDGNKRTAAVATVEFLSRNGYRLTATDWELYLTTQSVSQDDREARLTKDQV